MGQHQPPYGGQPPQYQQYPGSQQQVGQYPGGQPLMGQYPGGQQQTEQFTDRSQHRVQYQPGEQPRQPRSRMTKRAYPSVFPQEISPCEGERKLKEYHCSRLRSRFTGITLAEGILTVTNKRILYRTVGFYNDNNFTHNEVAIEDVAGISLCKGRIFDFFSWLITLLVLAFLFSNAQLDRLFSPQSIYGYGYSSSRANGLSPITIIIILALVLNIAYKLYISRKRLADRMKRFAENPIAGILGILKGLLYILWPIRSYVALTIVSKGGSTGPIHIEVPKRFMALDISAQVAPGDDDIDIVKQIGVLISNIQKYGDIQENTSQNSAYAAQVRGEQPPWQNR